jgi:hypothetical protein
VVDLVCSDPGLCQRLLSPNERPQDACLERLGYALLRIVADVEGGYRQECYPRGDCDLACPVRLPLRGVGQRGVPLLDQDRAVFYEVVEDAARSTYDACEWLFVHMDRKIRLMLKQTVQATDESPASRHDDSPVHDV